VARMPSSGGVREIKAEEESPLLTDGAGATQSYGTSTAKAITDGDFTLSTPSTAPDTKNYFESLDLRVRASAKNPSCPALLGRPDTSGLI